MSIISINLVWKIENGNFLTRKYSNQHDIIFNSNTTVKGDSAPDWNGNELNINPEQTLAASLSSCHMMTFLALAAKMSWPVTSYRDKAIATLGKNSKNKMSVVKIELSPKVEFSKDFNVNSSELKKVQDRAHRYCFIANSLSDEVEVLVN